MYKKAFLWMLIIAMTLVVASAGCTSSTNPSSGGPSQPAASTVPAASFVPQNNPGYLNYTNATASVRIQYPSEWTATEGGSNATVMTFNNLGRNASVSLTSSDWSSTKPSLDEFKNILVNELLNGSRTIGLNYTVNSTEKTTLAGMPAYNLTLSATSPSGVAMKQLVMITMEDYQAYVLTFSTTQGLFPDYQNTFTNMANSFAITS
jgi:hypothetical protein